MSVKSITIAIIFAAAAGQSFGFPSDPNASREMRADENAYKISDADEFLLELNQSMKLARAGDYGKISKADFRKLNQARKVIAELLEGRSSARELEPEQRINLYDNQLLITSIIRDDQKNRQICKPVVPIGTRLPKAECMTVAQREVRAREARLNVQFMQIPSACNHRPFQRGNC